MPLTDAFLRTLKPPAKPGTPIPGDCSSGDPNGVSGGVSSTDSGVGLLHGDIPRGPD